MAIFAQLDRQPDTTLKVTGTISPLCPPLEVWPKGRTFVEILPTDHVEVGHSTHNGTRFVTPVRPPGPSPLDTNELLRQIANKLKIVVL